MLRKRAVFAPHIVKGTMLDLGLQVVTLYRRDDSLVLKLMTCSLVSIPISLSRPMVTHSFFHCTSRECHDPRFCLCFSFFL